MTEFGVSKSSVIKILDKFEKTGSVQDQKHKAYMRNKQKLSAVKNEKIYSGSLAVTGH